MSTWWSCCPAATASRWQPEKVGLAWWHSQISQVTHYVISWAGDQCVIMSCRNSASPACHNSCAHWQLAPPLNIKMVCCFGTPTDAFLEKGTNTAYESASGNLESECFFSQNFTLKRIWVLCKRARDLAVTPTAVWGRITSSAGWW